MVIWAYVKFAKENMSMISYFYLEVSRLVKRLQRSFFQYLRKINEVAEN